MRYWWVNQNQTYKHEVQGGFLWSPKRSKGNKRNPFYDTMNAVQAGDIVLSFCDTQIKAIGIAQGSASSSTKPAFGPIGSQWDDEGWHVPIEFNEVENPVRPKDIIEDLRPHLTSKYAPLQANGNGNQGVYLAEVSAAFCEVIFAHLGLSADSIGVAPNNRADELADETALEAVQGRTDIGPTQKQQLVLARRGQGVFKANVRLNERRCRVTGVTDPRFLIASHIKPWRNCSDEEKLDGCNGLLLAPHIDRLFDGGFISFNDDGTILYSSRLPVEVLSAWGLNEAKSAGSFNNSQCVFLDYHRSAIFKG